MAVGPWLLLFAAGVFGAVAAGVLLAAAAARGGGWRRRLLEASRRPALDLSDSLKRWVLRAEKELGGFRVLRRGPAFFAAALLLAAAGFVWGAAALRNPAAGLVLAAGGVLLPEQVWFYRERHRREKLIEQLGAAVRVFAAEYAETPHPVKALGAAARRLPDPIGGILRSAERDLVLGKDRDEVLIRLARDLDSEYGRLFVQLLHLSFEDEAVKPLFSRLAARVSGQQELIRKNRVELAADRAMSLILNAAVVPAYYLIRKFVPEAHSFFLETTAGRVVVVCCLASAVAGMLLDRLVNRDVAA